MVEGLLVGGGFQIVMRRQLLVTNSTKLQRERSVILLCVWVQRRRQPSPFKENKIGPFIVRITCY